jgi:hypothetical protein
LGKFASGCDDDDISRSIVPGLAPSFFCLLKLLIFRLKTFSIVPDPASIFAANLKKYLVK